MRASRTDRVFDIVNHALLGLILLITLYPLWYVVIASVSAPDLILAGKIWILPRGLQLEAYRRVFLDDAILSGYRNTIAYTTLGTGLNLMMTILAAYPLSRRDWDGRRLFMGLMTFTMFFSGGLIPTYLVIRQLNLLNRFWALILPSAVSCWNVIIMRTFFSNLPLELQEAAQIDGCSNTRLLLRIVLPLSLPIVAVTVLYYAVGHWNAYFNALIYLTDAKLYPLQLVLRQILLQNDTGKMADTGVETEAAKLLIVESLRFAIIIVSSLPVLMIYPFIQRYFVKGVMIGAIKG